MKPVVLSLVILSFAAELSAVCRPSPSTGAGTETRVMPDTVILSAARPEARLPLSAMNLASNVSVLTFSVLSVQNPKKLPLEIALGFDDGSKREIRDIGQIALFPPDQPGRFALRIPAEIQKLLAGRTAEPYFLVISLVAEPVGGGDGRRVSVGNISWSATPE